MGEANEDVQNETISDNIAQAAEGQRTMLDKQNTEAADGFLKTIDKEMLDRVNNPEYRDQVLQDVSEKE